MAEDVSATDGARAGAAKCLLDYSTTMADDGSNHITPKQLAEWWQRERAYKRRMLVRWLRFKGMLGACVESRGGATPGLPHGDRRSTD